MKDWFVEWFDTSFYHKLYKNRNDVEAQFFIDNLEKKCNFRHSQHFLDLACGKGRHAIYLHSKGYEVVGIDLSPNNIQEARQSTAKGLSFEVHDMRQTFAPNSFDFVLNLFTSFGYFEDNTDNFRVIQAIAENLKPKGKLILDYMNSTKAVKGLQQQYQKHIDDIHFIISKKIENGFIIKNIEFDFENTHHHFQERVKALTFEEFQAFFKQAGLQCLDIYGNYALDAFDLENSDRMIFVAEKC